ncbi:MAG: hypothetical protein IPI22_11275 [Bacteroidetes bacterium]|nr:hypothetical protein [Bacteroidota bacterium]
MAFWYTASDFYSGLYQELIIFLCNMNNVCGVQNSLQKYHDDFELIHLQRPLLPPSSPTSGCGNRTSVVITGTNFTGATNVAFGGIAAQSF